MRRQVYGNISFPASRKRYGMITFLAGSGFKDKYCLFMRACRYEIKNENKLSDVSDYFTWLLLPWKVIKNFILYAVWFIIYDVKT